MRDCDWGFDIDYLYDDSNRNSILQIAFGALTSAKSRFRGPNGIKNSGITSCHYLMMVWVFSLDT